MVKNLPVNAGNVRDMGLLSGSGRSSEGGHGCPLQYSCLENLMDRGAWWATVHGEGCKELDTTERLGTAQHSTLSVNSNQVKSRYEVRERREGTVLSVEEPMQDAPRPQAL